MAMNEKDMWLAVLLSAQPWLVGAGAFLVGYLLGSIPFRLSLRPPRGHRRHP